MLKNLKRPEVQKFRGRPLEVIVVPSRIEYAESDYLNSFQKQFLETFREYSPNYQGLAINQLWNLAIPYVPRYAYKEILAVREKGEAAGREMVDAYNLLAFFLARFAPQNSQMRLALPESKVEVDNEIVIRGSVAGSTVIISGDQVAIDDQREIWRSKERNKILNLTSDAMKAFESKDYSICLIFLEEVLKIDPSNHEANSLMIKVRQAQKLHREIQLLGENLESTNDIAIIDNLVHKTQFLLEENEMDEELANLNQAARAKMDSIRIKHGAITTSIAINDLMNIYESMQMVEVAIMKGEKYWFDNRIGEIQPIAPV